MKTLFFFLTVMPGLSFAQTKRTPGLPSITKVEFISRLESRPNIQRFMNGEANDQSQAILEMLDLLNQFRVPSGGAIISILLERIRTAVRANIPEFEDDLVREQLHRQLTLLLYRFASGHHLKLVVRLFDLLWLWSPDELPFLAARIRNNTMFHFSTQALWAFIQADVNQRRRFIENTANQTLITWPQRWFPMAIASLDGHVFSAADQVKFLRSLSMVQRENLLPPPRPQVFRGGSLMTSLDLFDWTIAFLRWRAQLNDETLLEVQKLARDDGVKRFISSIFDAEKFNVASNNCRSALQ